MEGKIKIRTMEILDIPEIIKIGKSVEEFRVDSKIKGFWSEKQLRNWIKSEKDSLIVAEKSNKIIGFVMFAHHIPTGKVTWENAWIDNDFRGTGLIEKLTRKGIEDLKKKGANYVCGLAKTDNFASIKFLEKNKFMKGFDFSWLHRKI
ncbi:GNAT family N-acetyltransferase [Candidatus Pacearchaeota archaeon]|nr:GNAT family N-acetyltransferase [Candidatus Pacearchaeota archaeon]